MSTLSADAQALVDANATSLSLYEPENGPAVNVFAGAHLTSYFSVQANYVSNTNDVTLVSVGTSRDQASYYQQRRSTRQHTVVVDALVYFRDLESRFRPYLSAGAGVVHFGTADSPPSVVRGSTPPGPIATTRAVLRVAVGLDVAFGRSWSIRYSFSESLSSNPVSERLSPPAPRNLANFQSLFGVVRRF